MKILFLTLALFLILGCEDKEGTRLNEEFDKANLESHLLCEKYEDDFIKKAFVEVDTETSNDYFHFIQEEKEALKFIDGFRFDMLDNTRAFNHRTLIFKHCKAGGKGGPLYICPDSANHYFFFRGLHYGLKNYAWSKETKAKGLALSLKYLKFQTTQKTDLNERLTSMMLIKDLAEKGLIDQKHLNPATELLKANEEIPKKYYRKKMTSDCEKLSADLLEQNKASEELAAKISAFLNTI